MKNDPFDVKMKPAPPPARKLNKHLIIGVTVILAGLFSLLSVRSLTRRRTPAAAVEKPVRTAPSQSGIASLMDLPRSYADMRDVPAVKPAAYTPAQSKVPAVLKRLPAQPAAAGSVPKTVSDRERARRSKILFTSITPGHRKIRPSTQSQATNPYARLMPPGARRRGGIEETSATRRDQRGKQAFFDRQKNDDAVYLNARLQTPVSRYQVMAGSVLPAVLLSGINSDLPGQIIAQVRENIFDTVTGKYLLIPQGTKLLGRYDNMIAWGQERVLLVWSRLIFPDGSSILLDRMPGVDQSGYAGLKDRVNNHYLKLAGAILMSTFLSVGAVRSQGDIEGDYPSVSQEIARQLASDVNRSGQKIVSRQLNVPPTIEVKPGFPFHVMVNRDMILRPYAR